jgi:hypothetical protein
MFIAEPFVCKKGNHWVLAHGKANKGKKSDEKFYTKNPKK